MAFILVVEDERSINDLIKKNLQLVGHTCGQAFDGLAGLQLAQQKDFDLLLLDVMLPGKSGFEIAKEVPNTPIIFITAKASLQDKVTGFNFGADDYIVKPFEALEMIARVDAVLRRTQKADKQFSYKDVLVDFPGRKVMKNGQLIEMTPKEYELLEVLIVNRNIALSREKLLELAWGYDFMGDTRTVDNHIQKLRSKLGWEDVIQTVYKLGYRLET